MADKKKRRPSKGTSLFRYTQRSIDHIVAQGRIAAETPAKKRTAAQRKAIKAHNFIAPADAALK